MHKTRKICTLREGKKRRTAAICSKYARNTENMHTSRGEEEENGCNMLEVCTKYRKHAHFERERRGERLQHARSMHETRETCTLREEKRRRTAAICSKYARNTENMHTSRGKEGGTAATCSKYAQNTGNMHTSRGKEEEKGEERGRKEKESIKEEKNGSKNGKIQ